jgi:hypothetical protein
MKLILECDVVSNTILERRLELRNNGRVFMFELDADRKWNKLRVVAPVPPESKFKWGLEPVPEPRAENEAPYKVHANALLSGYGSRDSR